MDPGALPLSRAAVDRAALRRAEPDLLTGCWSRPSTRVMLLDGTTIGLHDGGLALHGPHELEARGVPGPADEGPGRGGLLWLYLGQDGDVAFLAVVLPRGVRGQDRLDMGVDAREGGSAALAALAESTEWASLRDVGHLIGDRDTGLAATAVALAAWHVRHVRCPRCGAPTTPALGGWVRRCTAEGSDHYPRTDPAVIMAVTDDEDRLLLGHAPQWPARRFSTLAGYVEPGESLEAAVRREVGEEVGVEVGEVTYQGSQPWPFPASLMLAFTARARTSDITVDGVELTEARWFTREELAEQVRTAQVLPPTRTSVARALIEEWFGGPLPTPSDEDR